jgi:hypothetical protein
MAELSLEEKVQKTLDFIEIQNIFAMHVYIMSDPTDEMDRIWSKKRDDICFSQSWGIWVGQESVKNYYRTRSKEERQKSLDAKRKWHPDIPDDVKYAAAGDMGFHMLTTPLIEIAEDGNTAKGMWYTPGFGTNFDSNTGKWNASWMYEKYAIDFVKEDGKWKIWHFCVYRDFSTPYNKSWVEASEEKRLADTGVQSQSRNSDLPPAENNNEYSTRRVWSIPKPPEPYRTFSETFSYGPTPEQLLMLNTKKSY